VDAGIRTISKPFPSPVKFIISSSAAVNGDLYPLLAPRTGQNQQLLVCNVDRYRDPGPRHGRQDRGRRLGQDIVLVQAFGTVRLNAHAAEPSIF